MPSRGSSIESEYRTTVLVVDDDDLVRAPIVEYLHGEGYEVLEASNADQAIDVVDRRDGRIDLVFSDVTMPGELDGVGLAHWVRVHHPHVAVLLATGYGGHGLDGDLMHEVRLIEKPYTFPQVLRGIRTMLRVIQANDSAPRHA